MIAPATTSPATQACNAAFLKLLPAIRRNAAYSFRRLDREAREDAVQEVIANAFVAFRRLVELGKTDLAYPGVLARYGVAHFRAGRRVGTKWNTRDVYSPVAQRKRRFHLRRLDHADGEWKDAVLDDRKTPVPDQAAFRCDFPQWLRTLSTRDRRIVDALTHGEKASSIARMFSLCNGRISQIRRELKEAWEAFHGELEVGPAMA